MLRSHPAPPSTPPRSRPPRAHGRARRGAPPANQVPPARRVVDAQRAMATQDEASQPGQRVGPQTPAARRRARSGSRKDPGVEPRSRPRRPRRYTRARSRITSVRPGWATRVRASFGIPAGFDNPPSPGTAGVRGGLEADRRGPLRRAEPPRLRPGSALRLSWRSAWRWACCFLSSCCSRRPTSAPASVSAGVAGGGRSLRPPRHYLGVQLPSALPRSDRPCRIRCMRP
jgi:hypothetical protein